MNRRRKALFLSLFLILSIDLLSFTVLNMYPEIFTGYLINHLGPEAPGLAIVGGFIIAIATSAALLLLSYRELRTIMGKPLRVKVIYQRGEAIGMAEKAGIMAKVKEIVEKTLRRGLEG